MPKRVTRYECSCCFRLFKTLPECRAHEQQKREERAAYDAKVSAVEAEALRLARESVALQRMAQSSVCDEAAATIAESILHNLPWTPDCSGWYGAMVKRMVRVARKSAGEGEAETNV